MEKEELEEIVDIFEKNSFFTLWVSGVESKTNLPEAMKFWELKEEESGSSGSNIFSRPGFRKDVKQDEEYREKYGKDKVWEILEELGLIKVYSKPRTPITFRSKTSWLADLAMEYKGESTGFKDNTDRLNWESALSMQDKEDLEEFFRSSFFREVLVSRELFSRELEHPKSINNKDKIYNVDFDWKGLLEKRLRAASYFKSVKNAQQDNKNAGKIFQHYPRLMKRPSRSLYGKLDYDYVFEHLEDYEVNDCVNHIYTRKQFANDLTRFLLELEDSWPEAWEQVSKEIS